MKVCYKNSLFHQKKVILIVLTLFLSLFFRSNAYLDTFEKGKDILGQLDGLIEIESKMYNSFSPDIPKVNKFCPVDKTMIDKYKKNSLFAKLISNMFLLNLYQEINKFLIEDFQNKGLGRPFFSYFTHSFTIKKYVLDDAPKNDSQFDQNSEECLIFKTFECKEGIRYFDQMSETIIYSLMNQKGVMVISGRYVFLDYDLNGIPNEVYFMDNYTDQKKVTWSYLLLILDEEYEIEQSTYQSMYIDSLLVFLEYIVKHYSPCISRL